MRNLIQRFLQDKQVSGGVSFGKRGYEMREYRAVSARIQYQSKCKRVISDVE